MLKLVVTLCMVAALNGQASEEFIAEVVKQHNVYRALHGVPDVTANATISTFAQEWANHLIESNNPYASNPNASSNGYGENMSLAWNGALANGTQHVDNMYKNGALFYDIRGYCGREPDKGCFENYEAYTQIVWKASTQIGVGKANGIVVVNYFPAGNQFGSFHDNVPCPES